MNIHFLTELPLWWLAVCAIAGFVYAYVLYRKDHSFDNVHPWLRKILFGLRAFLIFCLSVLLLTPLIKTMFREKEKPIIIVAQDNSQSISYQDSAYYKGTYRTDLSAFISGLKEKYDVKELNWGEKISDGIDFTFHDKQTDFSSLFQQVNDRYAGRNIGAVVIAGDGLYNLGSNPVYNDDILKVPYFTIALGDTTIRKDLLIAKLNYNKTVFLGNSFPIEIEIAARRCAGAATLLTVKQDSSVVFSKTININGNSFNQSTQVILDAKKSGIIHYKIELSTISGEVSTINNIRDLYIEVVESKQKVLVIGNAPHPDMGAIKLSLEAGQNYAVKTVLADQMNEQLAEYNLVILHNLPSAEHPMNEVISKLKSSKISTLYIVGSQVSINQFNSLALGLSISGSLDKLNPVQAKVNRNFSLFTVSPELEQGLNAFPVLLSPFGKYSSTTNNSVLLYQQIGAIATDQPLQLFNEMNGGKTGILCGEGIWKWRLSCFSTNGNFDLFNDWLYKTVQNLSVKDNKSHFRLVSKNSFDENEPITFDGEVYNDNYELINTPDINLTISNSQGKSYPFIFSKNEKAYSLNAGFMPSGDYKYKASVTVSGKVYNTGGQFSINPLQAELTETVADHSLMNLLAEKNGGKMFYPSELDKLKELLLSRNDIKTITYSHYKLRDMVDIKAIFFFLLAFLSLEWFLRKRAGSY